jgi:hypothetical protein
MMVPLGYPPPFPSPAARYLEFNAVAIFGSQNKETNALWAKILQAKELDGLFINDGE